MLRSEAGFLLFALSLVLGYFTLSSMEPRGGVTRQEFEVNLVPALVSDPASHIRQQPLAAVSETHPGTLETGVDLLEPKELSLPASAGASRSLDSQGSTANARTERLEALNAPGQPVEPGAPVRILIPRINLDAPVVPVETTSIRVNGLDLEQWLSPNAFAAGWHNSSALLGEQGNTVLNGHHNVYEKVFARLVDLESGDMILVYTEKNIFRYVVTNKMLLPEKYQELDVRLDNARWIMPSADERLTLITCWPEESNTHRLVIVAAPVPDPLLGSIDR